MRHPHIALAVLVDDRHAADPVVVSEKAHAHLLEKVGVDVVDDFEMARQHAAENRERPALQRFGQQCVVGIGERLAGDVPSLVPAERMLVDEHPHQFGDRDGRMRVVELHGEFLVKALHGQLLGVQDAEHILDRTRNEEVLLLETQFLAAQLLVVRVEHLAQVLGGDLLVHRPVIVAAVEYGEIERLGRLSTP